MSSDPQRVRQYHLRPESARDFWDNLIIGLRKVWTSRGLVVLGAVVLWVIVVMAVSPLLFSDPLWPGGIRRSGIETGLCLAGGMSITFWILRPWE